MKIKQQPKAKAEVLDIYIGELDVMVDGSTGRIEFCNAQQISIRNTERIAKMARAFMKFREAINQETSE